MRIPFSDQLSVYQGKDLPKEWVQYLIDEKLFKMFIPKELGGLELNLNEATELLSELAFCNGSLGWVLNLGAGANFFCGFFKEELAHEVFSKGDIVLSGSGFLGEFHQKQDKFHVKGEWHKCTGSAVASYFTVNAKNDKDKQHSFLIPKSFVEVKPSWESFGLRQTSSDSIFVEEAILDLDYAFEINNVKSFKDYKIYAVPFSVFARICLSATFEGLAKKFAALYEQKYSHKSNIYGDRLKCLNQVLTLLNQERKEISDFVNSTDNFESSLEETVSNSLGKRHFEIFELICHLYWFSGIQLSEENNLLHFVFRDIMTASQHYMLKE